MPNTDIIYKRKSIRKFNQEPLGAETLDAVQSKIAGLIPLYPQINYSIEIVAETKGMFGISAPHYLVFRSENAKGAYENIGFVGQQMDLYFSENGLGCCWLGMAKPTAQKSSGMPFVICMAFGKPAEELHRTAAEFKRKTLAEISEGGDARLEPARLAPSGMNAQGRFFIAADSKIHCYRKKSLMAPERLSRIDMGIALYHIALASESFSFVCEDNPPVRKGFSYCGTVV